MLLPWLSIFDFRTFRANFIKPVPLEGSHRNFSYAILIPIFNDTKYLTNIEFLKKHSNHIVLCTTTNETRKFLSQIQTLQNQFGFRVTYSEVGKGQKNPWAIYNKTLIAHEDVLKQSVSKIKEKFVIFIDGDTFIEGDPARLCGIMDESEFDIASVKVLPAKRETLIEKLQGVEYDIAMQSRLLYPWLTSGAGIVAKSSVIASVMKNHSLFFNGGDIEIGRLSQLMGYKVGHIPMVFKTDIPSTIGKWIRQRFSWMCGAFRHSIINMGKNLHHPSHFIYFTFIIYFLLPLKIYEMVRHYYLLPFLIVLYALLTYLSNWKIRSKWMFLFPFYALFQVTIIVWFGIYKYIQTVWKTGNIGFIRVRHNPNNINFWAFARIKTLGLKTTTIFGVIGLILITTSGLTQKVVFGRKYEPIEFVQIASGYSKALIQQGDKMFGNKQILGAFTDFSESSTVQIPHR